MKLPAFSIGLRGRRGRLDPQIVDLRAGSIIKQPKARNVSCHTVMMPNGEDRCERPCRRRWPRSGIGCSRRVGKPTLAASSKLRIATSTAQSAHPPKQQFFRLLNRAAGPEIVYLVDLSPKSIGKGWGRPFRPQKSTMSGPEALLSNLK